MEALFDTSLGAGHTALLLLCVVIALGFEFVNGFHDTANAVATVIYTNALRPTVAVVLSGVCNFIGVFVGGIAVAMGIMKLLPVELLVEQGTGAGLSMVLALLLSAILWNLATWYKGIPSSSSHTLIGAILGVGIGNSLRPGHTFGSRGELGEGARTWAPRCWSRPCSASPSRRGCCCSWCGATRSLQGLLVPPPKDLPPPPGTRALLVGTCTHGVVRARLQRRAEGRGL
jgi:PiT family inorganic phosphate transporter